MRTITDPLARAAEPEPRAHRDCLPYDDDRGDAAPAGEPMSEEDIKRIYGVADVKLDSRGIMGSIETPEALAYLKFRAAAQALKAANTAAVAASERFRAALAKLSEAAAP